jgi:hypothetical protein
MSKVTKIPQSIEEMIAEIEIRRLYDKSMSSSEGLSLEDTKKFDILVKTLRETQKDSHKEIEARYQEMKRKLREDLPTEALLKYVEDNNDSEEASVEQPDAAISQDQESEVDQSGDADSDRSE